MSEFRCSETACGDDVVIALVDPPGAFDKPSSGCRSRAWRRSVYSTQQDPIGIAGGANVYGFVAGDPVNHADPFGLEIVVVGQRMQDAVRIAYRESPIFRRLFDVLDNRRASEVLITIKLASTPEERKAVLDAGMGAVFLPNRKTGTSAVILIADVEFATAMMLSQKVPHELIHAAGFWNDITGVPKGCALPDTSNPCAWRQSEKIDDERFGAGPLSRTEERAIQQGAAIDARYNARKGAKP